MQVRPTGWKGREWESLRIEGLGGPRLSGEDLLGREGKKERRWGKNMAFLKVRQDSVCISVAKTENTGEKDDVQREGWSKNVGLGGALWLIT